MIFKICRAEFYKMERNAVFNNAGIFLKRVVCYIWYDIVLILYLGLVVCLKDIFWSPPILDLAKTEKRTGQVAVLTGGPRGLALGLIKRLVQMDYKIIIGVRNVEDGEKRLLSFAENNKDILLNYNKIKMLEMDLSSLESIRKFAQDVLMETSRIDLLLCNAAIMRAPFEITIDGYESQFQVNYLSNFLLTHLLLERIKNTAAMKGGQCQIIYTSSIVYKYGKYNPEELETPSVFTPCKFYFASKLYPVMAMLHLQRLLDNEKAQVNCYAVHPGLIPTDLWFQAGGYLIFWFGKLAKPLFRNLENGADTILLPSLSTKYLKTGGVYMESGNSISISNKARNEKLQADLYIKSLNLAGINKSV